MTKKHTKHQSFWLSEINLDNPKIHAFISLLSITTLSAQLFLVIRISYLIGDLASI